MSTHKSLAALESDWPEFTRLAKGRMVAGIPIYGDATFNKPLDSILAEAEAEMLDQANYAFMAWVKTREIRNKLRGKIRGATRMGRKSCPSENTTSSTAAKRAPRRKH